MKFPPGIKTVFGIVGLVLASFGIISSPTGATISGFTLHEGIVNQIDWTADPAVGQLQKGLGSFYKGGVDNSFGPKTVTAVKQWQRAHHDPVTGTVAIGSSEWLQLEPQINPSKVFGISPQAIAGAKQTGWSVDANKSTGMLYVLHYDSAARRVVIMMSTPTSFGGYIDGAYRPTPDGVFHVTWKGNADTKSNEWPQPYGGAPMPWAVFFYKGAAIHYDQLGASHECVHVPSESEAEYINNSLSTGDTVVIHG